MDVIALHRLGCPVGIATCGTSLTIDHIRTIQKYTDTVVFLFDADKAGIQATQRALGLAYTLDLYPQIAQLPKDYKDVDDLAQAIDKDSSISRDIDAHTQDGLLVVIQRMMADIDASSPIAKQRVLRTLFELVAQVRSLSIQQHYLTMIAQQLGMSDVIILAEYQTYAREARRRQPRTSRTSTDVQTEKPYTLSEADLLAALMLDQWIATQLSDVPDTAHLMTRSQYIADHDPDSLLGQVLSDNIDQSQRDHLIQLQLRRENERSTADNHADRLALITRRLRTYIQQRTQQIVKRMPTDAKLPMIQLMQQIVRG
jgi:DNA primase